MLGLLSNFLAAFAAALVLVPVCRAVARRTGHVAQPREDRWHKRPTALLGGVGIFVSTIVVALPTAGLAPPVLLYAVTGVLIFIVGLTDDILQLKPATKLVAQLALASVFVFFGYRLGWSTGFPTLDVLLTVMWIVAITNALNLLDNMDGLCAGVALVAGGTLLLGFAPVEAVQPQAAYLATMLGAIAGFLVYNVHPASVFMGDSGSLFIGLTLAGMSLELPRQTQGSNILVVVVAPLLVLLIPIFDMGLVTLMRLWSGRRAWEGGRDHSSHRLVAIGLPEKSAVLVLWSLALLGGLTAWGIQRIPAELSVVWIGLFSVSMVIFAVFLTHVRVYDGTRSPSFASARVTTVIIDFMNKRRVAEVLLDFVLVTVAYYLAYRLRYEGERFTEYFPRFVESLPMVLGIQMTAFFAVGAYRGVWRQFGLMDGVVIAKAVGLGTLVIQFAILSLYRFQDYSRAAYIIYAALLLVLATSTRASFRLMTEFVRRRRLGDRLLIYGAGDGGATALRELTAANKPAVRLLGFIDDDRVKHGTRVQGYSVLGGYDNLLALIRGGAVDQVVISMRVVDRDRLRVLGEVCVENSVQLYRLQVEIEAVSAVS